MLRNFLENLQSKPEREKIRILWAFSGITAILVLAIWISNFNSYKAVFNDSLNSAAESMSSLKASVSEPIQSERQQIEKPAEKPMENIENAGLPALNDASNPNGVPAPEKTEKEPEQNNNESQAPRLPLD